MSKRRHHGALIRTFGVTFPSPQTVVYPVDGWDQLIYALQGVVAVDTEDGVWVLPAHRALWVPDGVAHTIRIEREAALRSVYFRAGAARQLPRSCCAVNVSPLLRELILVCVQHGALRSRVPTHRRLAGVLLDQLRTLPAVPLQLPQPKDLRARKMAEILGATPACPVLDAAVRCGSSLRTMERLFRMETGLTLGAWLRRLKLQLGLESLAAGASVIEAARASGYSGASAFVSMFHREMGLTPSRYFDNPP